eukprot:jgi/Hompol1/839/HPOL_004380-RA
MLRAVRDKSDVLRLLPTDSVWAIFVALKAQGTTSALSLDDWHRILSALIDQTVPFSQPATQVEPQRAIAVLHEMKRCGVNPDAFVFACLYRACRDSGKMVMMIHKQVVVELIRLEATVKKASDIPLGYPLSNKSIRTLIAVLIRGHFAPKKHIGAVYRLWDQVINTPFIMTIDTYLAFLDAFTITKDKSMIERIHEFLASRRASTPWSIKVYEALMNSHIQIGNFRAARRVMDLLNSTDIRPRQFTYRLYLTALQKLDDHDGILLADKRMKEQGIPHSAATYNVLVVDALKQEDSLERVRKMHGRIHMQLLHHFRKQELLSTAAKRQSESRDSHLLVPITSLAYQPILEAYSAMGSLKDVLQTFKQIEKARKQETARHNESKGLPITTAEMIKLLNPNGVWAPPSSSSLSDNDAATDEQSTSKHTEVDTQSPPAKSVNAPVRDFHPPEASRAVLCAVVSHLAGRHDATSLREFFQKRVLTTDRLGLYWARRLASHAKQLHDLAQLTQSDIDNIKSQNSARAAAVASQSATATTVKLKDVQSGKAMHELKSTMSWINRRFKRGMPLLVGLNGPLSPVYTILDRSWRDSVSYNLANDQKSVAPVNSNSSNTNQLPATNQSSASNASLSEEKQAELLLELDQLMSELTKLEADVVLSLGFKIIPVRAPLRSELVLDKQTRQALGLTEDDDVENVETSAYETTDKDETEIAESADTVASNPDSVETNPQSDRQSARKQRRKTRSQPKSQKLKASQVEAFWGTDK